MEASRKLVDRMRDTLAHRGPDDAESWIDTDCGVALGFRRLAIIDLTADGRQPMHSASGRFVICFNGEVYNFAELRPELESLGFRFRGHSDTEVMLAAIEHWGLEAATKRFVGMFAFVLWDRQQRRLSLVRDRLGIKPVYYGWAGSTLLFGSELKALRAFPGFSPPVDRRALTLFLRYNYVPAPYTIYDGVSKLPVGSIVTFASPVDRDSPPKPYWSAREVAERGATDQVGGSESEAVGTLHHLLKDAIRLRMVADVPLGAFLSGGIDSSTVVALMQAQSSVPIRTFSIGFAESGYDEAVHAKAVARHLGTDHTELYVSPAEAQSVIPRLPEMYDEPFSDSSQIPTFLVSQLARRHVTVSLSGDGGDELFAGYNRYLAAGAIWQKLRLVPPGARRRIASLLKRPSRGTYDQWFAWLGPLSTRFGGRGSVGHKLHVLSELLDVPSREALYHRLLSHWRNPEKLVINGHEPAVAVIDAADRPRLPGYVEEMQYFDTIGYLPDDILTKVDRASMAVSLEARVPLLDHRVVEFAFTLPMSCKIRNGESKWALRQVLKQYVPTDLTERPKMGFGIPVGEWLRGPLRDWAEELLNEARLRAEGYLNPAPIREKWAEHVAGDRNWEYLIWDVLMFQGWLERWGKAWTL